MLTFKEHIVKVKGGYRLVSRKTGKNLGTYPSKSGAENRERQVQYFKHMGEANLKKTLKSLMSQEILRKLSNFAAHKAYNETVLVKKKLNYKERSGPADMAVSTTR